MSIHPFGTAKGCEIQEVRLTAESGASASILTFGAVLRDFKIIRPDGRPQRVVLGYDALEGYFDNQRYLGATVGRVANRIADGRFALDGKRYALPVNGPGNVHLHGGPGGFSFQPWTLVEHDRHTALLSIVSEDGDEGYPGRVEAFCRYELLEPATLRLTMTATCDAPTPVNMTNHSYFTLNEGGDCRDHRLWVNADLYTPSAETLVPTGAVLPVAGTPYDFREPTRIADRGDDFDINWALRGEPGVLEPAASVVSPDGTLRLDVLTDQPGLLLYTGGGLGPDAPGLDGRPLTPYAGLALETQNFVDAPNKRHFPSATLRPNDQYRHEVIYRFSEMTLSE